MRLFRVPAVEDHDIAVRVPDKTHLANAGILDTNHVAPRAAHFFYRRIDVRASRRVPTAHGGFSFFVELFNALGVNNVTRVSGYRFSVTAGQVTSGQRITESVIGVVPSFGITYEF